MNRNSQQIKYRLDANGAPVVDNRVARDEPAPSSPGRSRYRSERLERRAAARAAKAAPMHAVAHAARKAVNP